MPETVFLKDYKPSAFLISETSLDVRIYEEHTRVISAFKITNRENVKGQSLVLHGKALKLIAVAIDGRILNANEFEVSEDELTIISAPDAFVLNMEVEISPETNKSCEGLYQSGNILCTQNEPEGFRRITYCLDRPDVMSVYQTRIEADKVRFPVLLSNGNPVDRGDLSDGRHFTLWKDPFPKPSYLFALVAGDLGLVEDRFITRSGRSVLLQVFVDKGNEDRAGHALYSLKSAMKWDEDRFGLEYDLDIYMIVAVDAFNMGAMENKGLNIFNSTCVLANPKTATDATYQRIESIIAHEYFHNWTGNRVTCRDWFQLTLKEGLTVFRDQEYSCDMMSRTVKRIEEVNYLRNTQFVEDAGPTAHPIQPASYIEINNFYTPTVYRKGAEVIRMIHLFIGGKLFREGIDKYFELYDGQAVTTEDFIHSMEIVSGVDFTKFKDAWYHQAGTPEVNVETSYDESRHSYSISLKQSCRPTSECESKKPYLFPVLFGLLDEKGDEFIINSENLGCKQGYMRMNRFEETFTITGISSKPVPSFLRNFSAPVKLNYEYSKAELIFLFTHDNDAFNRYEAGQRLAIIELELLIAASQKGEPLNVDPRVVDAFGSILLDENLDDDLKAEFISMPSGIVLVERMDVCDFDSAHVARETLIMELSAKFTEQLKSIYDIRFSFDRNYSVEPQEVGRRALQNKALYYLAKTGLRTFEDLAVKQMAESNNMTDELAAFSILCELEPVVRKKAVNEFYDKWKDDSLVMNNWFAIQASSSVDSIHIELEGLEKNSSFDSENPNKIRSLYGAFMNNLVQFHNETGRGYKYLADKVLQVDSFNSNVAASLSLGFKKYSKLGPNRKLLMEFQLKRILAHGGLSRDVYEIVSKTLG